MSGARASGRLALLVLFLGIVYVPLEEFLLKWVPVGPTGYALLRVGFEGLLFAALAVLVAGRVARGLAVRTTPIDRALLAFVALALCSLFLSEGDAVAGLVNLRVLLRHLAVFYLAAHLELAPAEKRTALVLVLASAALQALVGGLQHFQGGAGEFWLPREASLAVVGVTREFAALAGGLEQGAVLGTTDHSVAFALFLLVGGTLAAAVLLAGGGRRPSGRALLVGLVPLAGAGILFSYARSCLFAFVLALLVLVWIERHTERVKRFLPVAALFLPVVLAGVVVARGSGGGAAFTREKETRVSPLASVEALFTSEYMQTAESSRLWVLRDVGGEIARSAGWLGLGPDEEHVRAQLLRSGGASLHRLIAYRAFEDVYWVALLAYYGFLGLAVFVVVLALLVPAALRARALARDPWERAAAHALIALLVVLVPLSFLAPTLDFRTFSYPFWLLAGLAAAGAAPVASVRVTARSVTDGSRA